MPDLAETVRQLTIQEKAALCSGADLWHTVAIPRLGIGSIMVADGPHGLRVQPNVVDHSSARSSLPATCFPTAAALASTWNTALIDRVGTAIAREARGQGITVVLGPGVNIKRSLLCGRNFEYFSEDPHLAGAARDRVRERRPVSGDRYLAEALRRQQPGDRPHAGQRGGPGASPARDLPGRVRAVRETGQALDRHVRLQPRQRNPGF